MKLKVLKFGGSSLADAEHFRRVAGIVRAEGERRFVIASAPGKRTDGGAKVTDLLYRCFELASDEKDITDVFEEIRSRYDAIVRDLQLNLDLSGIFEKIRLSVLHNSGRDYVASRGEYLSALILAEYLGFDFIDAEKVVFFHDDGTPDFDRTNEVMREVLAKHADIVIIIGKHNAEMLLSGLSAGGMPRENVYFEKTATRGNETLNELLREGDVVLFENDLPDNYN